MSFKEDCHATPAQLNQAKLNRSKSNNCEKSSKPTQASFRLQFFFLRDVRCLLRAVWAQKDAGSIVGTVKDQTGATVPNAKITVSDVERGIRLETSTNESGEFVAGPLRVGRYTVTVEHPGFKRSVTPPVWTCSSASL